MESLNELQKELWAAESELASISIDKHNPVKYDYERGETYGEEVHYNEYTDPVRARSLINHIKYLKEQIKNYDKNTNIQNARNEFYQGIREEAKESEITATAHDMYEQAQSDYKKKSVFGKLGAILCKVADVMHKGNEMPLLDENALMRDALLVMSEKMLGCVGIINDRGELTGIITDGDLRRWMSRDKSPDLILEKVTNVMTRNPKTISPDALIVDAVNMMNNTGRGITNIFAVQEQKPVGVIHIHDCLKAGVA